MSISFKIMERTIMEEPYSNFATNLSNFYYLHHSENPSLILVTPSLNINNFSSWSHAMEVTLISKNKLNFIDGTFHQFMINGSNAII